MKNAKFLFVILPLLLISINCSSQDNKMQTRNQDELDLAADNPKYEITVTQSGKELGKIVLETFPNEAPQHAANFDKLVTSGFYNGTAFHRVISGFMIQGGCPNSKKYPDNRATWGQGDPSLARVPAEFNAGKAGWSHTRGKLSAAR